LKPIRRSIMAPAAALGRLEFNAGSMAAFMTSVQV
jgi:hypothetical protein